MVFSELAAKYSECPSANRGGNLGTFKPGMMVKEFDEVNIHVDTDLYRLQCINENELLHNYTQVCFTKEVGVVHGPVETQFGSHLILVTRRYEGEDKK